MTSESNKVKALFEAAIELPSADREPFLDLLCDNDDTLREEVESLLAEHYAQANAASDDLQIGSIALEYQAGDTIGNFKILHVLGEGGMGIVYLAEQSKPVKRRVALKIIKVGMDTKQVIARFEAERQALALMSHPGIAPVYEAGTTDEGRPYFVQEYVKGLSITKAADEHQLDTTQRLELFAKVCDAVQHVHQKGIIHRDLKPSNILVSAVDGDVLEPKIIDFGVAKATSQQLTDKTLVTQVGRFIGTPAYMSPEQADLKASDIDTRSDVYALGVILYELLTGKPPFSPKALRDAGLEKMREIIRQQEPPKPSTQLSTLEDPEATKIAKARKTQIKSLAGLLRKEIEWIPLMALRKLPSERYDSAKCMGDDIRRCLRGEPLEAGPESTAYRVKKTLRRHKGPFIAAAIVAFVLIVGIIGTSIEWSIAQQQARIANEEKNRADKQVLVAEEARAEAEKLAEAAQGFLARMFDPESLRAMYLSLGTETIDGMLTHAANQARQEFSNKDTSQQRMLFSILMLTARTYGQMDMNDKAEPLFLNALTGYRALVGDEHPDTLSSIDEIGIFFLNQGKYDVAKPYLQEVLETRKRVLGNEHPDTLSSFDNFGILFLNQSKYALAKPLLEKALKDRRRLLGVGHPDTLRSMNNMGVLLSKLGKYNEAEVYYRKVMENRRNSLEEDDPDMLNSIVNMCNVLLSQGKYDEILGYFLELVRLGWDDSSILNRIAWNAVTKSDEQFFALVSDEVLRITKRACELSSYEDAMILDTLAHVYFKRGEIEEAIKWQEEAVKFAQDGNRQELAETLGTFKATLGESAEQTRDPESP